MKAKMMKLLTLRLVAKTLGQDIGDVLRDLRDISVLHSAMDFMQFTSKCLPFHYLSIFSI